MRLIDAFFRTSSMCAGFGSFHSLDQVASRFLLWLGGMTSLCTISRLENESTFESKSVQRGVWESKLLRFLFYEWHLTSWSLSCDCWSCEWSWSGLLCKVDNWQFKATFSPTFLDQKKVYISYHFLRSQQGESKPNSKSKFVSLHVLGSFGLPADFFGFTNLNVYL